MKIDRDERTGKRMVKAWIIDEEPQALAPEQARKAERMEVNRNQKKMLLIF
ncbi:MAG TPA: hypothetical protein PLX08_14260 [Bacteroidales bacterium]|nr:hypothetical protein [Bacteroidales bacterium]